MSPFGCLDAILLLLILLNLLALIVHLRQLCYLARPESTIGVSGRRKLVKSGMIEVGVLKSIALITPYLGLVGTCLGILSAFGGVSMAKEAWIRLIATRMATALIPTALAIPVSVVATCFHNYFRTRFDALDCEVLDHEEQRLRRARAPIRLKRFSNVPPFAIIAATCLVISILGFMSFASFRTSKGFPVEVAATQCDAGDASRFIVLHLAEGGKLYINEEEEDWKVLPDHLSQIYGMRENRTLYLLADPAVRFQTVAEAIDVVENASADAGTPIYRKRTDLLGIKVQLITPQSVSGNCPLPVPIRRDKFHHRPTY